MMEVPNTDFDRGIVNVISEYVDLKARGAQFIGLCPFHEEATPSFNVDPMQGIFKCFRCGEGGDLRYFLERIKQESAAERLEVAWGIIAVTSGGNWERDQSEAWIRAAKLFKERYFRYLNNEVLVRYELPEE